jgi:hypothetical protein
MEQTSVVDEVIVTARPEVDWAVALYAGPAKTALGAVEVKRMVCEAIPT